MKTLFIILAVFSIPLVFLTMYSRTFKGLKIKLGSFFILRDFKSKYFKIRTLKDISLLILRLCFAVVIVLIIIDPSHVDAPERNTIHHESDTAISTINKKYALKLTAPQNPADRYDEDLYFLNAFIKNYRVKANDISVVYNPSEKMLDNARNNIIVFPSKKQARNAFLRWIDMIEVSSLRTEKSKIKDTDINIKAYYPILTISKKIKKYAETEDGNTVCVSFEFNKHRILLFSMGISSYWGDMGVSGYFIDIIEDFINNTSLSKKRETSEINPANRYGEVKSILSFNLLLYIAAFILLIELAVYIYKARSKLIKNSITGKLLIIFIMLFSSTLAAEDFKFIELTGSGQPGDNKQFFSVIKRCLEEKTSIRISPEYYVAHSAISLANGIMPEFPYLWIFDNSNIRLSSKLSKVLIKFIERGGIIFVDLKKSSGNTLYYAFFKNLGSDISGNGLIRLPADHPIYKSFYLLNMENFAGVDVSISTKRTALIVSDNNLRTKVLRNNENAKKTGINIVLYMLSGNYKSDQIHTRQILKRLKKRDLFR